MIIQKFFIPFMLIFFISIFSQLKINAQEPDKKIDLDIVFIGNSITAGAQLKKPKQEAPPVIASENLRQRSCVGEVEFINQGRSGYTTVDYLPSIGGALEELIVATRQLHKDNKHLLVFSISLGTNDSAENGPNGSPVSPKSFHKNLHSIIKQLLVNFPNCRIILQQPIWYSPNTYNSSEYMEKGLTRLQSYFLELQALVFEYSQRKSDHVFLGNQKGYEYFKENCLTLYAPEVGKEGTFYLHPNKEGASILGNYWATAIYEQILFDLNSFDQKMIGFGGELSVLSLKPNVRIWVSKAIGLEVFGGVASELKDLKPNDLEAGLKILHTIQYNQADRIYIGIVGKWKWVNINDSNHSTNLPIPGLLIGKEWYSKGISHNGFAIELGYQIGTKEYELYSPINHIAIGKENFTEFPLILNLRYTFYRRK